MPSDHVRSLDRVAATGVLHYTRAGSAFFGIFREERNRFFRRGRFSCPPRFARSLVSVLRRGETERAGSRRSTFLLGDATRVKSFEKFLAGGGGLSRDNARRGEEKNLHSPFLIFHRCTRATRRVSVRTRTPVGISGFARACIYSAQTRSVRGLRERVYRAASANLPIRVAGARTRARVLYQVLVAAARKCSTPR